MHFFPCFMKLSLPIGRSNVQRFDDTARKGVSDLSRVCRNRELADNSRSALPFSTRKFLSALLPRSALFFFLARPLSKQLQRTIFMRGSQRSDFFFFASSTNLNINKIPRRVYHWKSTRLADRSRHSSRRKFIRIRYGNVLGTCTIFSAGHWSGYFEKVGKREEFAAHVPLRVRRISDSSSPTIFANNTCYSILRDVPNTQRMFMHFWKISSTQYLKLFLASSDRKRIVHLLLTINSYKLVPLLRMRVSIYFTFWSLFF